MHQRFLYQNGKLLASREEALYDIPGWRWLDHEEPWMDMLKRLRTWQQDKAAHVTLSELVRKGIDIDQPRFSTWLNLQRAGKPLFGLLSAYQLDLMSFGEDFPKLQQTKDDAGINYYNKTKIPQELFDIQPSYM